jgi:hypothetical protein
LPTLGIGKHTLEFNFYDKQKTAQILEQDLVIIPRAPQIKTPEIVNRIVTLNGTGLAGAQVEIFLTNNSKTYSYEAAIDTTGAWIYTTKTALENGRYTAVVIARKYGYASKYSEAQIFDVGSTTPVTTGPNQPPSDNTSTNKDIFFSFSAISLSNIGSIISNNRDLLILIGAIIIVSILIGLILGGAFRSKESKKTENLLKSVFQNGGVAGLEGKAKKADETKKKYPEFDANMSLIDKLKKAKVADTITKEEVVKTEEYSNVKTTETQTVVDTAAEKTEDVKVESTEIISAKSKHDKKDKKKSEEVVQKTKDSSVEPEKIVETPEIKDAEIDTPKVSEPSATEVQSNPEKVLSKEDFLMKFKDFDPDKKDKSTNNEKKPPRNIKITLTAGNDK